MFKVKRNEETIEIWEGSVLMLMLGWEDARNVAEWILDELQELDREWEEEEARDRVLAQQELEDFEDADDRFPSAGEVL